MKRCPGCGSGKPQEDFNKNRNSKDGLQTYCRDCQKGHDARQYLRPERKKAIYENNRRYRAEVRGMVDEYLDAHPCLDCGEKNRIVLEFDHVRGKKMAAIATLMSRSWSWKKIRWEIGKCEVRCANCHRIRHASE